MGDVGEVCKRSAWRRLNQRDTVPVVERDHNGKAAMATQQQGGEAEHDPRSHNNTNTTRAAVIQERNENRSYNYELELP